VWALVVGGVSLAVAGLCTLRVRLDGEPQSAFARDTA
jgi:hypothetical protein